MATFVAVPLAEARASVVPPRVATQFRYQDYIKTLRPSEGAESDGQVAGRLVLETGDKPITERARLKAAAKAEGVNLNIQRRGNVILFWPTESPPKPRQQHRRRQSKSRA